MKCSKCEAEMFEAIMTGNTLFSVMLTSKKQDIWEGTRTSKVTCQVCSKCGFVELYAADLRVIRPE